MPSYKYEARDMEGRRHTGAIVAQTEQDARKQLRNRELFATDLREESQGLRGLFARRAKRAA